jgi:molecular chaperone GrpE
VVDDNTKQALLGQFSDWLDAAGDGATPPDDPVPATDLYSLLLELAGLRAEVRTESRLVKEALDQFRDVFDTLRASQAILERELGRARSDAQEQTRAALRPLLLDVVDLRERLRAALKFSQTTQTGWWDRMLRRKTSEQTWQDGLRLTLERLDQVLLERRVVALRLEGLPFDPRLARVIATSAESSAPDGAVIEVVRTGFLWDDQVLQTAEVVVSKSARQSGDTP